MASDDHKKHSEEIKQVHLWLRKRSQEIGPQEAWLEHLKRTEVLTSYSKAMKSLAEDHWTKVNQGDRKEYCRIDWIVQTARNYFFNGIFEKEMRKEDLRFELGLSIEGHHWLLGSHNRPRPRLKLLDVGSCYNPFGSIDFLETFPIDLCPASSEVCQCNFLDVSVSNKITSDNNWFTSPVSGIPAEYFDIVVFCLFLEYLPCPELRLKACRLAWETLTVNGILVIVTPDSNHQSAHSMLMKEWNLALIRIGFVRFTIEKLKYLYCMAFRKTKVDISNYLSMKRYQCDHEPILHTPQDHVDYTLKSL